MTDGPAQAATTVKIDVERVQAWLFAVPRLRAMVGANTLLGEVLRIKLPALARTPTAWTLVAVGGNYPQNSRDDPLGERDNPASDANDGIVSRDGGHFEARFRAGAEAFADAATGLLRRELPGLRFRVWVDDKERSEASAHIFTELPVLAPCEWTGRGVGSVNINQGPERKWVSLEVERRHQAAKRAEDGDAEDLASLLIAETVLEGINRPDTFESLAELKTADGKFLKKGYLALIHADGNGVGRARCWNDDVRRATYYHYNRVMLRRATRDAIDATCAGAASAPLIPLMLGGDDLLIVCRAEIALPFVEALCAALEEAQSGDGSTPDGMPKLTLGVGVVIARPTIPINRLHDVAEGLAASAKRRVRGHVGDPRSVVDWAVYTTTWMDDPEEIRRRDWIRGAGEDQRILSRRPMDVLGAQLDSLKGLIAAAEKLKTAPRSQLRYLVDQLPKGLCLSELAFKELSKAARDALCCAGLQQVWNEQKDGWRLTSLLDLVEVYEIERLGRAPTAEVAGG